MNDTATPKPDTIIVHLSGRRPLRIKTAEWPIVTEANWAINDGITAAESNRDWALRFKVRQDAKGRTLVYATYEYLTSFENEFNFVARVGRLYDGGYCDIEQAISFTGEELRARIEPMRDTETRLALAVIDGLVAEAINALPPEDI